MQPTEREMAVFRSLSQSGEGDVIRGYCLRLADHLTKQVIDDKDTTLDELAGIRFGRKIAQELGDRFTHRARMNDEPDRFD